MSDSRRGALVMLLSAVFFAAMGALIRGTPGVHAYVMGMARFICGTLVCLGLFVVRLDRPRWVNWRWLLARGVVGSISVIIFYRCIQLIGLARATVLHYTYVIWAAVFAVPILGERMRPAQAAMVGLAVVGIVILFDMRDFRIAAGDLLALTGGICAAFSVVAITRCRETDSSTNIFWSQSMFGIAAVAWPTATHWAPPTLPELAAMVAVGLFASAAQLLMTYAFKHTGATQGALLSLATPVLGGLVGVLYFREAFSVNFALGALLILVACGYLTLNPVHRRLGPSAGGQPPTG